MLVEVLSLFTALCYSISTVFILKGMKDSNPNSALLLSTSIQVFFLTCLLLTSPPRINWTAVLFFSLSGILASGFGRLFNFISIRHLGIATSSALGGTKPLIATVLALMFLGERVAIFTLIGTILVVSGVFLISGGVEAFARSKELLFPILSASFYGLSEVVRKTGLNILPDSLLGAQVGATSGMLGFLTYLVLTRKIGEIKVNKKSFVYFSGTGATVSIAWILNFTAMRLGTVSIVSTLTGTTPLFSLLLSWLILRGQENLGYRVTLGSLVIVAGATLVTLL